MSCPVFSSRERSNYTKLETNSTRFLRGSQLHDALPMYIRKTSGVDIECLPIAFHSPIPFGIQTKRRPSIRAKCIRYPHSPFDAFVDLSLPEKGYHRCYLVRHRTRPPARDLFLPLTPMFLRLAHLVVQFYLLPDRHALICQQRSVEATKFFKVAAVDDFYGGRVFFAQPGDGINVIPVGDVVGWDRSGDVSSSRGHRAVREGRTHIVVAFEAFRWRTPSGFGFDVISGLDNLR